MIKNIEKPNSDAEIFQALGPVTAAWFKKKFGTFTLSEKYSIIPIKNRKNILLSSPTGSGKTLSAFTSILDYLIGLSEKNELENKVYCVYISPLKALSRDIEVNLKNPLQEMQEMCNKKFGIRVSTRTGDTTTEERQKMLKNSPHILITTPESLAIVLSSKKFIELLKAVEFIIVDEIHALANKRGSHLSLSLERLHEVSVIKPVRIGLSATISPLEEIARFLVGYEIENKKFVERDCLIANVQFTKQLDLKVLCPIKNIIKTNATEIHDSLYGLLNNLIQKHKTTLTFTNTRSATERVIVHLKEMFPNCYEQIEETIGAHHSSLSKQHRLNIEQSLREGKLKCVVTSTSLELGIDIGYIDLVVLLGSPKSVARFLQRIGRAGHKLHDISKGRLIVLDQDDLVECSVLLKEAIEKKIDKIQIPKNCLDVLSQQIFGMSIQKKWQIDEVFDLIRKSYCYNGLTREDFLSVVSYLSGDYSLEHKNVYAKIWYNEKTKEIGKRGKLARVIYMTNIGTIPDESFMNVIIVSPSDKRNEKIGVLDEAFLDRMKPKDVFVLGGHKYEFLYTKGMNIYVNATVQRPPTIPSWVSEMLPLSFDLALAIQKFRKLMQEKLKKETKSEIKKFIKNYLYVDENSAEAIYNYFWEQHSYLKIPHETRLLIEYYRDENGKLHVIFHSLYGRRVNDALSQALAYLVASSGRRDVEIGINDNGFFLASHFPMQIEKAIKLLVEKPEMLREILEEAIDRTEIFKRHFRHCATRSLMILRNYKGQSRTVGKQQMKSDFLLSTVKKISNNFPILKETRREILEDLMDIKNAIQVLKWIKEGRIKIETTSTEFPSPFALGLVTQGIVDLLRMENKIKFLKRMHRKIMEKIKK